MTMTHMDMTERREMHHMGMTMDMATIITTITTVDIIPMAMMTAMDMAMVAS
ncbi:hypothetical protein HK100_003924, partial [Physocladia obscura]